MTEWCIAFTSGLASTFIGLIIGIPIALLINRAIESANTKNDRKHILFIIQSSLKKNIELLKQVKSDFVRSTMPFYTLDIVVLDSISKEYHILLDNELSNKVDECRYELAHITRKIDKMFSLYDQIFDEEKVTNSFEIFKKSIASHATILLPKLQELYNEIEKK